MCGRFQLSVKAGDIAQRYDLELFDELHRPQKPGLAAPQGYNCAPMQWLPVILNTTPTQISHLRWGLLPPWLRDVRMAAKMINSRIETITEKPAFRNSFTQRRCLIPANGFYEWKKNSKQPYRISLPETAIFSMAGIWERRQQSDAKYLDTFSIITTAATGSMKQIHHRMPVILSKEKEKLWLDSTQIISPELLLEWATADAFQIEEVSQLVNSVYNDGPKLLEKDEDDSQLSLF